MSILNTGHLEKALRGGKAVSHAVSRSTGPGAEHARRVWGGDARGDAVV